MKRTAFTLVELLVVIAIIGLLSTIAAVNLSGSRSKAKIAAGQSFDQSLRNGLGDQLVGEWLFNECAGNTTSDVSGNGNTATFSGGASWSASNAPGGTGCSANLFGGNYLNPGIVLRYPSVTFSEWIYPTTTTGYITLGGKELQYRYDVHDGVLRSLVSCNGTSWAAVYESAGPQVQLNAWSMVAYSVDSTNQTAKLYLNGSQVGSGSICTITGYNNNFSTIGSGLFYGYIDDARTYATALSLSAIQKLYADGLPQHLMAVK